MLLTKTEKQPYESYYIHGDFSQVMETGESISSYATLAEDKDGNDATSVVLEADSEIIGTGDYFANLYVRVQNGIESASPYKITIRIVTSNGNKWEVDGKLIIREI